MIKKIITNKILIYLVSRYGTYAIQFLVSIGIASKLGPYYMGIYGFVTLILNYCSQINFGVPHSLNVLMVHNKSNKEICNNYIWNSFFIYGILSSIVALFFLFIWIFNIPLNSEYHIEGFYFLIAISAALTYVNAILTTVLRVKNKVNQLSIVQSINTMFNLLVIFFFDKETLIFALVICQIICGGITLFISYFSNIVPKLGNVKVTNYYIKEILHKGFYLFMYNSCFYFILLSIRSVVSDNYKVEEFGAFTFSFTVANGVLLLLESLMTIIFPKIIDMLSSNEYETIEKSLANIRVAFISSSHFVIYIALLFFPIIIMLLPKYSNALTSMNLIALSILMNTNSYGYSTLLIAQNKEKTAAFISLFALLINIMLAVFLVKIVGVEFSYIIIATIITYLFFSYAVVWKGKTLLGNPSKMNAVRNFFPIRLFIPYLSAVFVCMAELEIMIWIPLTLYLLFDYKDIVELKNMGLKLINNPNIADV